MPINDELVPFAEELRGHLASGGVRAEVDGRTESLNRKIREAQLAYVPLILTVGNREKADGSVSVRTLDGTVRQGLPRNDFIAAVTDHNPAAAHRPGHFRRGLMPSATVRWLLAAVHAAAIFVQSGLPPALDPRAAARRGQATARPPPTVFWRCWSPAPWPLGRPPHDRRLP